MGKSGLALLRLVISSYFIAISLDVISGVDTSLIFQTWFDKSDAQFIGNSLMAGCSLFVFVGVFLRMSCLYLALLVLSSTVMENVIVAGAPAPDALWRDIVFVSALMLIYGGMSRQGLNRAALVTPARKVRKVQVNTDRVTPRRVSSGAPANTPKVPAPAAPGVVNLSQNRDKKKNRLQEDVSNIFADTEFSNRQTAT